MKQRSQKILKEEFEKLKEFDIVEIKRVRKYNVLTIITTFLLTLVIIATFIYFVIPLHETFLTVSFIGGIVIGLYNISLEFISPEKHLHWYCKIPEDFDGWKSLYLISKCIEYDPEENITIIQFSDKIESELEKILYEIIKENETQE